MKKDRILFDRIMKEEVNGYKKYYLFSRKFYGEEYKFYLITDRSWVDNSIMYCYQVETPANCFGYHDIIRFCGGCGYGLDRYHTQGIIKNCKQAFFKRGFRGGGLENNHNDFQVYFKAS